MRPQPAEIHYLAAVVVIWMQRLASSLTDALYVDGRWRDFEAAALPILAMLILLGCLYLDSRRKQSSGAAPSVAIEQKVAPTWLKGVGAPLMLSIFLACFALFFWRDTQNRWNSAAIPMWYQFGLRTIGVLIVAGASWLLWNAVALARDWKQTTRRTV